jgi:hypothetical protein
MKGKVSKNGYKKNSLDVNNDYNIIPSGNLTMRGVQFPVTGIDNYGNVQHMMPGVPSYTFPGSQVLEIPHRQFGGPFGAEYIRRQEEMNYNYPKKHKHQFGGFNENVFTVGSGPAQKHKHGLRKHQDGGETEMNAFDGGLSPEDARQALIDGHILGQELSSAQRTLFSQVAGTDEEGNLLDENGEVVDESSQDSGEEDMRHGGQHNIRNRSHTSKNIKSSINELFLRNHQVYGPSGKHIYNPKAEEGGETNMHNDFLDYLKKGGWIKDAVNPAHKGFCTPETKSTCTPRRKAFAETMKKHHGFHQEGGENIIEGDYENNFDNPFFQDGGQFKNPQAFAQYHLGLGHKPVQAGSQTEFYDPANYAFNNGTWSSPNNSPITGNHPQQTFGFTAPAPPMNFKQAAPKVDTSSNPYHAVSFDSTGKPSAYYNKSTGQTVPATQVMQERQAQISATPMQQKMGGENCFECGGEKMMNDGGEFLKSIVKNAYKDVMKAGGENKSSSPQGVTQDQFLNNRNNTFKNYLSNTAMFAMAQNELQDLHGIHQEAMARLGGGYMQQGGEPENSDAYWNTLSGYDGGADMGTNSAGTQNVSNVVPHFNMNFNTENGAQSGQGNDTESGQGYTSQMSSDELAGSTSVNPQRSSYDLMSNAMQHESFQQGPQQKQKSPNWFQRNRGPQMAEGIIGGMNFISAGLNAKNTRANENLFKQRTDADNIFSANTQMNRGQYETNSGKFKPNQNTIVQRKQGGDIGEEQFLSDAQIKKLKAQGYKIEFLD